MRIVSRGMAITLATVSLTGSALAAPVETVLYSFAGGSDGAGPIAGLITDKDGALYGTTLEGGTAGYGTVFKLTPPAKGQTAWTPTVLYRFTGGSNGANPHYGGLIFDKQGALYGATYGGGSANYGGTVFKLTPPAKGLIADQQGALYGTTFVGGSGCQQTGGCGAVFKLNFCPEPKWNDWRENDKDHDHDGCPVFVSEE